VQTVQKIPGRLASSVSTLTMLAEQIIWLVNNCASGL